MTILIFVFWSLFGLIAALDYAPYCKDMSRKRIFIISLIIFAGGPILAIASMFDIFLKLLIPKMPNDWEDDNDIKQ